MNGDIEIKNYFRYIKFAMKLEESTDVTRLTVFFVFWCYM